MFVRPRLASHQPCLVCVCMCVSVLVSLLVSQPVCVCVFACVCVCWSVSEGRISLVPWHNQAKRIVSQPNSSSSSSFFFSSSHLAHSFTGVLRHPSLFRPPPFALGFKRKQRVWDKTGAWGWVLEMRFCGCMCVCVCLWQCLCGAQKSEFALHFLPALHSFAFSAHQLVIHNRTTEKLEIGVNVEVTCVCVCVCVCV